MTGAIRVLFASASDPAIALARERMRKIFPELPLVIVSEFQPPEFDGEWIQYHVKRSWRENLEMIRSRLSGAHVRICAAILEPRTPHGPMRFTALRLAPLRFLAFNETGEHFMLHPRSALTMLRYGAWRTGNFFRWQTGPKGTWRRWAKLATNRTESRASLDFHRAIRHATRGPIREGPQPPPLPAKILAPGISVVIPSRDGRELLEECLRRIEGADEIIVVDNGSSDGTAGWLARDYPHVMVDVNPAALGFAAAVNRGIDLARFTHVCVLNNDMHVEPGFLAALREPFREVPDLFAATAQIFFPEGERREETGKTVFVAQRGPTDFPIRCDDPLAGEDRTYVLYGSGGCTLFDTRKLAELGGFDPMFAPAYVEDLDLGIRAWQRCWPTVLASDAQTLHLHRATTARFFTDTQIEDMTERNFARFLARTPGSRFRQLWCENALRLKELKKYAALHEAASLAARPAGSPPESFLDLCNGDVAIFRGIAPREKPRVLVASPYLPFPLSHGAAVRIYNLMRRAARDFDQILVAFVEQLHSVPQELRDICTEIVTVRRPGSHALPSTPRPDTVEEFDSPTYRAALRQTMAKWKPAIAQLEFTQMAQYAADCAPARTILVEHDITFDLYEQMLRQPSRDAWELRRQYDRWVTFEKDAWQRVDRVVTMSERDRALAPGSIVIPNGVDLERFQPSPEHPAARRLLFIGSFAHKPNVLAVEFFLRKVWSRLHGATLHIIAGQRHDQFYTPDLPGVELEGFVADVRPAYRLATVVIAPLIASAGTNIKIMEAMAMGKAIVSTEAGVHGLELERGRDAIVTDSPDEMAAAITRLFDQPGERVALERNARATAERLYGWDAIAERQRSSYDDLMRH